MMPISTGVLAQQFGSSLWSWHSMSHIMTCQAVPAHKGDGHVLLMLKQHTSLCAAVTLNSICVAAAMCSQSNGWLG